MMKCDRCGVELSENETYSYLHQTLCEDCYMDVGSSVKACDPWAVYAATRARESSGLGGTEGLTDLQKSIYELVKSGSKVTVRELMANFGLSQREVETQIAILRHCELVKGHKESDKVYLIPFR